MTKLVTIKATFENRDAHIGQRPLTVEYFYEANGGALNEDDKEKMEAITKYHLDHNIYPVFVIVDNGPPLVGEAWVDLGKWTKEGLPMFKVQNIEGGKLDAPTFRTKTKVKRT